jgi:hypothetical protein
MEESDKFILPQVRDQIDARNLHIDGTPDGNYALRILRFYRLRCNEKWIVEGDDKAKILYDTMNEHQDLRAVELDKAISILEQQK